MPAIGVGVGPAFQRRRRWPLPTQIDGANLVLWLRANQGVTLSSASVSNDTTTWTLATVSRTLGQTDPSGIGTNAIKLTDTVDGAPALHRISSTWSNFQVGPGLFDVWLKPGTLSWARIAFGTSATGVYVNCSTGVQGTGAGGTTARLIQTAGAWQKWRCECTSNSATSMIVDMANADNSASYQGNGTGTIFVASGETYGPVLTQDRVSAWADQSGAGNHATQATAGSQPLFQCLDGAGLWVPSSAGTNCRIGWPLDVAKSMNYPATLSDAFEGTDKPATLIVVARLLGTLAAQGFGALRMTQAPAVYDLGRINASEQYQASRTDDASLAKLAGTTAVPTSRHSMSYIYSGTTADLYVNGTGDAGNPLDLDVDLTSLNAALVGFRSNAYHEIIGYKAAEALANARRVENGARARWGLAPV